MRATGEKAEYSARVEDRLRMLRAEHERRQHDEDVGDGDDSGSSPRAHSSGPPPQRGAEAGKQPAQRAALELPVPNAEVGQSVSELKHTLTSSPSREKRIEAARDLGASEEPDAMQILVDALNDRDPQVRAAVVEALGDYVDEITPDTLQPALQDPEPNVRFEAVTLLGLMQGADAMAAVETLADDPDPDVRDLAEEAHHILATEPTPLPVVTPPHYRPPHVAH